MCVYGVVLINILVLQLGPPKQKFLAPPLHLSTEAWLGHCNTCLSLVLIWPLVSVSCVSLCNIIPLLIWRLQSVSYAMLEVLYTLASISLQVPLLYQPSQMRTGLETLLIGNPQLVCWSSLVPIPSHGPPRNSPPFLVLPQRWNIVLWPQQLLSCHSFVPCSRSLICSFITFQSFNVIISQLLPWLQIQFFIPGPSTLRLIIILSEKRL